MSKTLQKSVKEMIKDNFQLGQAVDALLEGVEKGNKENEKLKEEIKKLKEENEELKEEKKNWAKNLTTATRKIQEKKDELEQDYFKLEKENEELKEENQKISEKWVQGQIIMDTHGNQVADCEKELEKEKAKRYDDNQKARDVISELSEKISELEYEVSELRQEKDTRVKEMMDNLPTEQFVAADIALGWVKDENEVNKKNLFKMMKENKTLKKRATKWKNRAREFAQEKKELREWVDRNQEEIDRLRLVIDPDEDESDSDSDSE